MLKEFFCRRESLCTLLVAWGGLVLVLAHAAVHGWIKFAVNAWYKKFYDLLEDAGAMAANHSLAEEAWIEKQQEVWSSLVDFCKIAIIPTVVMPIAKYVRSTWALQWRLALMRTYVSLWNPNSIAIEGASQRVHEDSYRFSRGVELCLSTVLDSVVTLGVFVPVLTGLGENTPCPSSLHFLKWLNGGWLVGLAILSALVGLGVTLILGHRLVGLEVQNQIFEAKLRKGLVVLETTPVAVCAIIRQPDDVEVDVREMQNPNLMPPLPHFLPIFEGIQRNYNRLFINFGLLNLWLAFFEQFNVILPYLVFGPLLFSPDPSTRILLGTLVQVSNSFDKVFSSLNVIADNWSSVNEFRSVLVRLRQFERNVYRNIPHPSRRESSWPLGRHIRAIGRRPHAMFGPPMDVEIVPAGATSSTADQQSVIHPC
jgi:peptide/bleomycin uptake transporter